MQLTALVLIASLFSLNCYADGETSFGSVSVNYLDWTAGTEGKSAKEDFTYLEIEGGATYEWGELYGFFDYENPFKPAGDVRTANKGSINYYLFGTKISLYAHVYNFAANGFSEQNRVFGLGYSWFFPNGFFKPFLGVHDVTQTFFSGTNGMMGGWVVGYFFDLAGQKFMLLDWHEYEFNRHRDYARGNGGRRESNNGAASVWWLGPKGISLGAQYRYATDKLGTGGSLGATIFTLKYFL